MPLYFRQPEEIAALEVAKVMMIDEPEVLDNAIAYLPFEFSSVITWLNQLHFILNL